MTHHHLYTKINDICYRFPVVEKATATALAACEDNIRRSSSQAFVLPGANLFKYNLNFMDSEFVVRDESNKTCCQSILNWVKEQKATSITDLRDYFKVEVDYTIYTASNVLISEGTMVETICPLEIVIPEDLTDENEMLYRKAIHFAKSIKLGFNIPASYGCMKSSSDVYFLQVRAVRLKGVTDDGPSDTKKNYLTDAVIDFTGNQKFHITSSTEDGVVLFDTKKFNIKLCPERIDFRPREIIVDLSIVMNDFCQFKDENEILMALAENGGSTSSSTGNDLYPCHPNIHPHCGKYIPHPTIPIHPMRPPVPILPPEEKGPEDPTPDIPIEGGDGNEGESGNNTDNPSTNPGGAGEDGKKTGGENPGSGTTPEGTGETV